ncbi:MOP flippase [Gloeophyllum trabeum ATCC 11539]|uniref:MOP flippase n=1 Tax=Gloeophyllum trabeum (strain ATCC 11539 / FP-39264 / Madison 617) TaxID=670483 RepID=S7PZC4_GLOTA|nr:MOP flippase [Gloeophyllum trabeum ATCC 11539]EPQ52991.1 MOP flippase [Gloeophyllum trabeum ATCC 11539]
MSVYPFAGETEPLLRNVRPSSDDGTTVASPPAGEGLLTDSVPVILSYILQNSIQTASILIAGRLGPNELSIAAFSSMLAFVTGWIVALGGTTALDTFGSQAFTGGARRSDLSIHFQRCLVLLWALLLPVCGIWGFMEPILLALGQEEFLSKGVQSYLRVLIFGAPGYIGFESLKKYLQCQGIMGASTLALLIVSPINIALNIGFVHYTCLGLLGSPVALSITYWLLFLILILITRFSSTHKKNETWGGIQVKAALDPSSCLRFYKLAFPGILQVGTEWAAFEIVALAAGRLGPLPLAAQSVIMTTDQSVAASARVGNFVGARSVVGAKHAAHASALLAVVLGLVVMILLISTRNVFGYIFSDDQAVVTLVSKVMPLVASFQVADGLAGSCGGVLRGLGRQRVGALFNFVAYYVLALPMGISLAFRTSLGLQGLWIGQVVGLFIVGLGLYGVVWLKTDWELEVRKGIERNLQEAKRRAVLEQTHGPYHDEH